MEGEIENTKNSQKTDDHTNGFFSFGGGIRTRRKRFEGKNLVGDADGKSSKVHR